MALDNESKKNKLEQSEIIKEINNDYNFNFQSATIEYYQNAVGFFLSTIVSLNICYYMLIDNNSLYYSWPFLFFYFLFDLPFCRFDVKLHHFFGLCMITSGYILSIPIQSYNFILLPIYKTEISTFFLIFKLWNKDDCLVKKYNIPPKIFALNDLIFFLSFFKFRLFDYYNQIIINPSAYYVINKYSENNIFGGVVAYTGIFGLLLLNSYWFCIMCKMLFKKLKKGYSEVYLEIMCEKILSYTYFLNILIAGYSYSDSPNSSNIYDMVGITTLSIFSYKYHDEQRKILLRNNNQNDLNVESDSDSEYDFENNKDNKLFISYLKDKLAIHFRSFLCLLTSCNFDINSPFILNNKELLSLSLHTNFFIFAIIYIYFNYSKNTSELLIESPQQSKSSFILNILISTPILYDSCVVISNSNDFTASINLIFIHVIIGFILKMKIFYEMNHLAFHILLMVQTYFLTRCNLRANL